MSKVSVKKIKVPIGANDENLSTLFNQMLKNGSDNLTITYPKYKKIRFICENVIKIFSFLPRTAFMASTYKEHFKDQCETINRFCEDQIVLINELFNVDLTNYESNLTDLDDQTKTLFNISYEKVKESSVIKMIMVVLDRLAEYKDYFSDLNKLNHQFILLMPGVKWCPFPFNDFNIKYILSLPNIQNDDIMVIMTVLNKLYELSRELYDELRRPDIDVDQFVDTIMNSLDAIKKRPELHRCGKAFKKIEESVTLLKNQFSNYYRDFVATKDSTIIMQHFIIDVSKSTSIDAELTHQFRTIISFYQKTAQNQITDPRIKSIFDRINASFNSIDENTRNLAVIRTNEPVPEIAEDRYFNTPICKSIYDY